MNIKNTLVSLGALLGLFGFQHLGAEPADVPIFLVPGVDTQVMINMSNDHQLFYKAYDDWSDLDPVVAGVPSVPETTYKHQIDYYGYFDAYKCYTHNGSRFVPAVISADKYCAAGSNYWSGNFLNWATMTRMDTVRKTLYGGLRSTDTSALTVLERAYLPNDAHSFAKYYASTAVEIGKLTPWSVTEITLCNTTYDDEGVSEDSDEPPLIRVARGNFALWAANERWQCHWDDHGELEGTRTSPYTGNAENNGNWPPASGLYASSNNPDWDPVPHGDRLGSGDYEVRVAACVDGLIGKENCKYYPTGSAPKPIGLLQEYGEDGDIEFGLITGSYQKNKSGGTLRKNIGPITDEINITTDGTFKSPPAAGNIIGNLSALRISGYCYDDACDNHLRGTYNQTDNCAWGINSFNNGQCTNWGNPQSELYLESLRYFAGASRAFNADDSSFVDNVISAPSWTDPLGPTNYCAPLKIIHFNASVSSYDTNSADYTGASDLADLSGASDVSTWTNAVGAAAGEGIDGNEYFIGEGSSSPSSDGICTAKTLANLSAAEGLCPEAPRLEGGYDIAGLAYYAHTNSIRDDIPDGLGNPAEIKVETFGVTLAPAVPQLEIPVPGSGDVVTILPACRNSSVNGNCAIVDFKIVDPYTETAPGIFTGKVYVNWEDSEQGGDFDQDMAGVLRYAISSTQIAVGTTAFAQSTPNEMGFGYIIAGTTQDGFHAHSGINGFDAYDDPTPVADCSTPGISCVRSDTETVWTYTLGSNTASVLKDPLYYAAKWGGFKETDIPPNGPDKVAEWDADGDDQPDNYFFARNPGQLNEKVGKVFEAVDKVSSSASVVANSVSLETTTRIYQARFDSTDWSGQLLSFPVNITTGELETEEWDAGEKIAAQPYTGTGAQPALPAPPYRNWITWNDSIGDGVAFRWANLTTGTGSQQEWLNRNPVTGTGDALGSARLNYLRGDSSNELAGGSGNFRDRSTPLGDVVHSTPTVVAAPSFGYRDYIPGTTTLFETAKYSDFKIKYGDSECVNSVGAAIPTWSAGTGGSAGGREPMLYFGGNDGALHAVSACTGYERLAYVPNALYPKLSKLTSSDYSHEYYVDGASTVVDAFLGTTLGWRTVLVGTLRGGGKAVFALDVTDPNNFTETGTDPADVVLWEKDSTDTGYSELGYTFSQPAVVKAEGHGWVAVFGNGYDGGAVPADSKAVLYIADISNGNVITSIDLSTVDATAHGAANGLSTVAPIDLDGDGDVDLIYAGDRNGNVWRFASTPGFGFTAGTTTLLYSARSVADEAQPITSRMAVGFHPTSAVGRMVYFGTGKYYEQADQNPANAVQDNTMYGIWDRDDGATITSVTTRDSNVLQKQTITTQAVDSTFGSNTFDVRVLSNTPVAWATPSGNCAPHDPDTGDGSCGWYLDLTDTGEKMVSTPILRGGRLIFVTTIPSLLACDAGGSGWLMEIDPSTGGRLDTTVFDLNGDGLFDYQDNLDNGSGDTDSFNPISGKKSKVGILQPPAILSGVGGSGDGSYGGAEGKYSSGTEDAQIDVTIENPGILGSGRKSWARIK